MGAVKEAIAEHIEARGFELIQEFFEKYPEKLQAYIEGCSDTELMEKAIDHHGDEFWEFGAEDFHNSAPEPDEYEEMLERKRMD